MNSPVFYSASRSNIVPSCSILPSLSWVGTSCKYLLILCLCTVMVHSLCVCVFALWRESCLFAFFCDCLLWDLCFLARCKAMFLICVCFFVCLLCNFFLFCVKKGVCLLGQQYAMRLTLLSTFFKLYGEKLIKVKPGEMLQTTKTCQFIIISANLQLQNAL